jgi:hypothetical protein
MARVGAPVGDAVLSWQHCPPFTSQQERGAPWQKHVEQAELGAKVGAAVVGAAVVGVLVVGAALVGALVVGAALGAAAVGDAVVGDAVVGDAVVGDAVGDGVGLFVRWMVCCVGAVVGDAVVGDAVVGDAVAGDAVVVGDVVVGDRVGLLVGAAAGAPVGHPARVSSHLFASRQCVSAAMLLVVPALTSRVGPPEPAHSGHDKSIQFCPSSIE